MTAVATTSRGRGGVRAGRAGYRFSDVIRMEWIKLRSQRGMTWTLAATAVAMIGIGVAVGAHMPAHPTRSQVADYDLTNSGLAGLAFAQLAVGVLGALVMTGEYSSGLIRATLAAVPRRRQVLAAKAAVLGAVALVTGEIMAFATFFALRAGLPAAQPHPALSQPGVLRAVVMAGAYLCLVALIGTGIGALIRHTAGAIGALVGLLFVAPIALLAVPGSMADPIEKFLPMIIAENSLTAVKHASPALPVWAGFGMLCLYAAVLRGAGAWLLARRDA